MVEEEKEEWGHTKDDLNFTQRRECASKISIPKGPCCTKITTTIAKIANYYAVVFLYYAPHIYYAVDAFSRGKMSVIPRTMVSAQGAPR